MPSSSGSESESVGRIAATSASESLADNGGRASSSSLFLDLNGAVINENKDEKLPDEGW